MLTAHQCATEHRLWTSGLNPEIVGYVDVMVPWRTDGDSDNIRKRKKVFTIFFQDLNIKFINSPVWKSGKAYIYKLLKEEEKK